MRGTENGKFFFSWAIKNAICLINYVKPLIKRIRQQTTTTDGIFVRIKSIFKIILTVFANIGSSASAILHEPFHSSPKRQLDTSRVWHFTIDVAVEHWAVILIAQLASCTNDSLQPYWLLGWFDKCLVNKLIFIFILCRHELLSFWAFCYVPRSFSIYHLVAKVITGGISRLALYKQKKDRNLTYWTTSR